MAPAASFVCSVENTKWPVSAACTAISAVSASRISPTMITSGSWRTIERSPLAKVNRIFDGDDFLARIVDLLQRAIKRSGLSAAGRSSDQDHAVGLENHFVKARQLHRRKAQGFQLRKNLPAF